MNLHGRIIKTLILLLLLIILIPATQAQQWAVKCPPYDSGGLLHLAAWDSTQVYLATDSGYGIYKATVGEWEWTSCSYGLPASAENSPYQEIYEFYSNVNQYGRLWVSTGDSLSEHICYSIDSGASWEELNLPDASTTLLNFVVHPVNPDSLLLQSFDESLSDINLYFSANGGLEWELVQESFLVSDFVSSPSNPDVLLNGVTQSTDFGRTWSVVDTSGTTFVHLVVNPYDENSQYGIGNPGSNYFRLGFTSDSGLNVNWRSRSNFPALSHVNANGRFFWLERKQVFYSDDNGEDILTPITIIQHNSNDPGQYRFIDATSLLSLDANSNSCLVAGASGIAFTDDMFENLAYVNDNFPHSEIDYIKAHPTDPDIYHVGRYFTTDGGNTWTMVEGDYFEEYYVNNADPSIIHFNNPYRFLTSDDYGVTRSHFYYHHFFFSMEKVTGSYFDSNELYAAMNLSYDTYIAHSLDCGADFDTLKIIGSRIYSLKTSQTNPDNLYAATIDSFYYSFDQGLNWTSIPLPHDSLEIKDILCGFTDPEEVYIISRDSLFHSTIAGLNWENIPLGFGLANNASLKQFVSGINFPDEVFIVVENQAVARWNLNEEWELMIPPDNSAITCFDQAADGKYLLGSKRGLWIYDPNAEVNNESNIPTDFALLTAFPNPFNNTAKVKFNLNKDERILLTIYNTLGQQALTLLDEISSAGNHELTFNAEELSSGIYFLNLKSETQNITQKMVLLR